MVASAGIAIHSALASVQLLELVAGLLEFAVRPLLLTAQALDRLSKPSEEPGKL